MAGTALVGSLVGGVLAWVFDHVYATKPSFRRPVMFLCTCLLCSAVGGASGWTPGEISARSVSWNVLGLDDEVSIIRAWIGICAAIGLAVGLLLGTLADCIQGAFGQGSGNETEENQHEEPRRTSTGA